MSELRRLSAELCEGLPLGAAGVRDLLHLAGARGSVVGLSFLLDELSDLSPAFEQLGVAYSGVRPWIDLLGHAEALLRRLHALRDQPTGRVLAISVERAFQSSDDGRLEIPQKAGFVDILATNHSPMPAARLVRAAAYLAGVIRQATHKPIHGWEDSANPESWLLQVVNDFAPLAERGVGADAALQPAEPMTQLARECARAVGGLDPVAPGARLPEALRKLSQLFESSGAQDLGVHVKAHFDALARVGPGSRMDAEDSGDAEIEDDADPDEQLDDDDFEDEADLPDPSGATPHTAGAQAAAAPAGAAGGKPRLGGKRGDRPSNRLTERQILLEHRRAFLPSEQEELTALIAQALTEPARLYPGSRPAADGHLPLLVAAVARCLARTVASATQTRIVNYERTADLEPQHLPRERFIFISHLDLDAKGPLLIGYTAEEDMASEHRAAGLARLPLPVPLSDRLRQLAPDVQDATLEELLPFLPGGWGEAAGQWLVKRFRRFNGSIGDFNLANRHSLARSLFASTSNRALIDLACVDLRTSSGKQVRTVSLSSYLYPGTPRDKLEYLRAACSLVSTAPPPPFPTEWEPAFTAMPVGVLRILGAEFRRRAVNPPSARERHEAVAVYTLLALVLGTGHRESANIFHFPWDLDLDQAVAFLCDKLSIGSEARFIPLVRRLVLMVQTYRRHLVLLIEELKGPHPTLAKKVAAAAGLPPPGRRTKGQLVEGHPVGQFFLIRDDEIVTIDAQALQDCCRQVLPSAPIPQLLWYFAPGSGSLLDRLRRNIATYLWTGGASGAMVEAFLGHNRKLHIFGEASTWSVMGDLTRVLPLVDRYLDAAEWQPLDLGTDVDNVVLPTIKLPQRRIGTDAYEGRQREASLASARARRAVRQAVLGITKDESERITLDDAAVAALRDEAAAALGPDPAAHDKLLQAFAELSRELKLTQGVTISAVEVATKHQEPGPVEVGFARDLALAGAIRTGWPATVQSLLVEARKNKESSELEWLAVIATSLVVNDTLLDLQQLWPILESIHSREVLVINGRAQVRASVVSPRAEFERVVYLSRASTAAVVGLYRTCKATPPADREVDRQGIEMRIAALIDTVPGMPAGAVDGLGTLASVFRPWWFLRLPGVAYAIAIGQRDSPSCDAITEATLLGATPPQDSGRVARLRATRRAPVVDEIRAGSKAIREFLELAEGNQLQGTQASRRQRQELRSSFRQGVSDELTALMVAVPMAALRVDFIEHLLINGGLDEGVLAFSSILTYDGRLTELYARWWHSDPRTFSSQEFDEVYADLLRRAQTPSADGRHPTATGDLKTLRTALRNFHAFMRRAERAPDAPSLGLRFLQSRRRMPRSALLAPRLSGPSLAIAGVLAGEDAAHAEKVATLLNICRAYGTRRKEALYSLSRDYRVRGQALSMLIQSNAANKLKNPAHGTRLVPFGLAGDDTDRLLRAVVSVAGSGMHPDGPIFADPTGLNRYLDFDPISRTAIGALKLSSGNALMDLHCERHGFGTRAGLASMPEVGQVAPVRRIRTELAVDAVVEETIGKLSPCRDHWPFQIDRASMWHGNAGVANYLDTYFHGGSWLLAEYADANAIDDRMNPAHWAALMGMDRTNILHQRRNWKEMEGEGADQSEGRVVGHFLDKLKLKSAAELAVPGVKEPSAKVASAAAAPGRIRLTLAIADSLLTHRRETKCGLEDLAYIAESDMRLRADEVRRFIDRYRDLHADTGFMDFEPKGGELAVDGAATRAGVARSAPRRQALLSKLEDLQRTAPMRDSIQDILSSWRSWIKPRRPLLVSRKPVDTERQIEVLLGLGFTRGELQLHITPSWLRQHGEGSINGLVPERDRVARFSRGADDVAVAEAGVEVVGRLESALVSNADMHRALVVACACCG